LKIIKLITFIGYASIKNSIVFEIDQKLNTYNNNDSFRAGITFNF